MAIDYDRANAKPAYKRLGVGKAPVEDGIGLAQLRGGEVFEPAVKLDPSPRRGDSM